MMQEKNLVKLLLHESQKGAVKIEFQITSELEILIIDDTVQKRRELYTKHKNYEKILERRRTKNWRKVKEKETEDNFGPR